MLSPNVMVVVGIVLGIALCIIGVEIGLESGGKLYFSFGLCTAAMGLIPYLISRR